MSLHNGLLVALAAPRKTSLVRCDSTEPRSSWVPLLGCLVIELPTSAAPKQLLAGYHLMADPERIRGKRSPPLCSGRASTASRPSSTPGVRAGRANTPRPLTRSMEKQPLQYWNQQARSLGFDRVGWDGENGNIPLVKPLHSRINRWPKCG